jgi:hypothetical protein
VVLCAIEVVKSDLCPVERRTMTIDPGVVDRMMVFEAQTVSVSSTMLVRRSRFCALGGFDPQLSTSADWDFLVRALATGGVQCIQQPLVQYRVHEQNMSRDVAATERDMLLAFKKAFADPRIASVIHVLEGRAYGRLYRMLAGSYHESGDTRSAVRAFIAGVRHDPRLTGDILRLVRRELTACWSH